ncbi:MAG: hypothetical protein WCT11_02480 [Candidatus Magasanikbacteria bacterium]
MRGVKNLSLIKETIILRKRGLSYDEIILKTGVSRSNLSSWFSGLVLNKKAEKLLLNKKKKHLVEARAKAFVVLKNNRNDQQKNIGLEVNETLSRINFDKNTNEALLTVLYLGEGFKTKSAIGLGNSNPEIMKLFVGLLRSIYKIDEAKFRIFLHLRYDQGDNLEKKYWSQMLLIPLNKFGKTQFDKRTQGSKTWKEYHGVCSVYYYDAKIEKRLTIFQKSIINRVLKTSKEGG